jgi:hypothetical protein
VFYVDHILHGRLTIESFIKQLIGSAEFSEKSVGFGYTLARDPVLASCLADPDVQQLSARLAACDMVDRAQFDRLVGALQIQSDLVIGQDAYIAEHHARFWELFNAAAVLVSGVSRPRVLEFGASTFSSLYRQLIAGSRLFIADRRIPHGHDGFDEERCMRQAGQEAFFEIDLEDDLVHARNRLSPAPPMDLIVFTEVLEHLNRNPVELFSLLLDRLASNGVVYITTPNVFSLGKLHLIGQRRNPQQVAPRVSENWDAHHHVREYSMGELVEFVREAGGSVRALQFSSCWDTPDHAAYLADHPDQRGNLVLVASRAPTAGLAN